MKKSCPAIVVAGTHSGVGKTSVSLALTAALKKHGLTVQTFKVGPDFLDPTYLAIASGRQCYNLDGWMTGREYVRALFENKCEDADVAIIEGVMGLYDGADAATSDGSTAQIAEWLDAPVLLVLDSRGMARSIAAVVKGYCELEAGVEIFGVIANNRGSDRHAQWLKEALASASLPPLLGAIPKKAFPKLPARHLGLVPATAKNLTGTLLDELAQTIEKHADLDEIVNRLSLKKRDKGKPATNNGNGSKRVRIGIAFDCAFSFYYPDNLEAMQERGAELVRFSPVADKELPGGLDGLYIGGGYPELFADELMENVTMLDSIRTFAESGRPVYAECGGLVYLSKGVETKDGKKYRFAGILPAWTRMRDRFSALGYVDITLTENSMFGSSGKKLRGHRFHYSELMEDPAKLPEWKTVYSLKRRLSDGELPEGYQHGNVLASYVHAHLASRPETIESFIATCELPVRQEQLAVGERR